MMLSDIAFNSTRSPGDLDWTPTGDLATVSGLARVRESIMRRLTTRRGSLLHRPSYGCDLLQYQNAPLTLATQQRIIKIVSDACAEEAEVTSVNEVSIAETSTPSMALIKSRVSAAGYENVTVELRPFNLLVG